MLFATTNRLSNFDQAYQNRIHLSVAFNLLEAPARTDIWRQHISRANQRFKETMSWAEHVFECLGQLETNGRDIRNHTRTAARYARANGEHLALRHVITVIRNNFSPEHLISQQDAIRKLDELSVAWI
jgi:SpoVK/Ycf46/Vps4 family AAA+-type ATPase